MLLSRARWLFNDRYGQLVGCSWTIDLLRTPWVITKTLSILRSLSPDDRELTTAEQLAIVKNFLAAYRSFWPLSSTQTSVLVYQQYFRELFKKSFDRFREEEHEDLHSDLYKLLYFLEEHHLLTVPYFAQLVKYMENPLVVYQKLLHFYPEQLPSVNEFSVTVACTENFPVVFRFLDADVFQGYQRKKLREIISNHKNPVQLFKSLLILHDNRQLRSWHEPWPIQALLEHKNPIDLANLLIEIYIYRKANDSYSGTIYQVLKIAYTHPRPLLMHAILMNIRGAFRTADREDPIVQLNTARRILTLPLASLKPLMKLIQVLKDVVHESSQQDPDIAQIFVTETFNHPHLQLFSQLITVIDLKNYCGKHQRSLPFLYNHFLHHPGYDYYIPGIVKILETLKHHGIEITPKTLTELHPLATRQDIEIIAVFFQALMAQQSQQHGEPPENLVECFHHFLKIFNPQRSPMIIDVSGWALKTAKINKRYIESQVLVLWNELEKIAFDELLCLRHLQKTTINFKSEFSIYAKIPRDLVVEYMINPVVGILGTVKCLALSNKAVQQLYQEIFGRMLYSMCGIDKQRLLLSNYSNSMFHNNSTIQPCIKIQAYSPQPGIKSNI